MNLTSFERNINNSNLERDTSIDLTFKGILFYTTMEIKIQHEDVTHIRVHDAASNIRVYYVYKVSEIRCLFSIFFPTNIRRKHFLAAPLQDPQPNEAFFAHVTCIFAYMPSHITTI